MLSVYERRARLLPGLLGIAPVSVAIVALGLKENLVIAVVTGFLSAAGGGYALSLIIARFGRRVEDRLWPTWGGAITTQMLRTRGTAINASQRDIWREAVTRYTGIALLAETEELADEARADDTIRAAIGQCRPLGFGGPDGKLAVQAENIAYGFERNTYGFRWPARGIAVACILLLLASLKTDWHIYLASVASGVVIDIGFLLYWSLVPSTDKTRKAADRYANQLLNAVAREPQKD
ncbi:hypothetical protein ASC64_04475 [Nocardioides sp. Root122]|uniref:hypothetical protein n=1 Tax=Nocardioides TaxID=1839 RepID=UPI000702914A|nr:MULTISPECIES: hypothetical protein [Nocardioides]KQV71305.1 hypothetical protein ASC64_04475 [Nocardioides sp. Root122]MCK9822743.1 hypothetical protein [Nocardioides cavernae]